MNTYNENLHSSIVTSLNSLEMDKKKVKSKLNSAKTTLYFDQGTTVNAAEKYELAKINVTAKNAVKKGAVNNSTVATNVLAAANQAKTCVDQSVSNIAIGAANVQIAANAIVRLASDMGSILSIVKAESKHTDLYNHANDAYCYINNTAYNAELASQHAMEASAKTAEVSSPKVAEKAHTTNEAINSVLEVASAEFDNATLSENTDNAKLALARTAEKASEGIVEDVNVEYVATYNAYDKSNRELNMNLRVDEKDISSSGYKVNFNYLETPFWKARDCDDCNTNKKGESDTTKVPKDYPVTQYNIFLVREEKKYIFSLSDAENLLTKIELDTKRKPKTFFKSIDPTKIESPVEQPLTIKDLVDSDGNEMKQGKKYVVFIMAVYNVKYKNTLNNFNDYLSAPSKPFSLRFKLKSPNISRSGDPKKPNHKFIPGSKTMITKEDREELDIIFKEHGSTVKEIDLIKETIHETKQTVWPKWTFTLDDSTRNTSDVQYRCMFLPANPEIVQGLLTAEGLRNIEQEEEDLVRIAEKFDPLIDTANDALNKAKSQLHQFNEYLTELTTTKGHLESQLKEADTEKEKKPLREKQKANLKAITDQNAKIKTHISVVELAQNNLTKKEIERKKAVERVKLNPVENPGIFFDLKRAENIGIGSYKVADEIPTGSTASENAEKDTKTTGKAASGKESDKNPSTKGKATYGIEIKPEFTDNFGSTLIDGYHYVPVVFTITTALETYQDQYVNIISDYKNTASFQYKAIS